MRLNGRLGGTLILESRGPGARGKRCGSMRVLQLGVGAVGEVNARVIVREPAVKAVVLADIDESRLR